MSAESAESAESANPASKKWTVGELLAWTADFLRQHQSSSPRLDAEVLLAHVRRCPRIMLYTTFNEEADAEQRSAFRQLVKRRSEGVPVAYLVGQKEFYSLPFEVTPDVLIPRPETEFLVVTALDLARQLQPADRPLQIADVGTGSGAVAVCLSKQLPDCRTVATDVSEPALAVARRNVERHQLADRIELLHCDLLHDVDRPLDLIVSNPPYVTEQEFQQLPRDVGQYEPNVALVGGPQGLEITWRLVEQALSRLAPGGALAVETSPMLEPQLREHFESSPEWTLATVTQDLAGLARIVAARKN